MSKRNRDRRATSASPFPPAAPRASAKAFLREHWEGVVAVVALLVAGAAAYYAWAQADVAKKTYDRLSGRIQANLRMTHFTPEDHQYPPGVVQHPPQSKYKNRMVFESVEAFRRTPFTVTATNMGDEPIDAFRVEVRATWDRRADQELAGEKHFDAGNIGLKQSSTAEYVLNTKLHKGHTVTVRTSKLILDQMMEVQPPSYPEDLAYGVFEVSVAGRMVGSNTFDVSPDRQFMRIHAHWLISKFDRAKVKAMVAEMSESPLIDYEPQEALKAMESEIKAGRLRIPDE